MYKLEKPKRQQEKHKNPCFSSSLLNSSNNQNVINTKNRKNPRSCGEAMPEKQSKTNEKTLSRYNCYHFRDKEGQERGFRSTSTSSGSCSSVFSSSDTEFMSCRRPSRASSCFFPPKPIKTEQKQSTLSYENREFQFFDDYNHNCDSATDQNPKTRSNKVYSNLQKAKSPVSPGGRIASFISSFFNSTNNPKKSAPRKSSIASSTSNQEGFIPTSRCNASSCSSASSLSRSCLSKSSERLSNGVKRSVRFHEGDNKPGEKGNGMTSMSVSLPNRRSSVEEIAREFLRDYREMQKDDAITRNVFYEDEDEDGDDDVSSDSSSDLFELDVTGNERYREELPVYETTHVGLIM